MTVKSLSRLVADGVPGADQLLQEFARNVAVGIINLQQTLAPGLFIVHGEIVTGGEQLRALISQQVLQGVAHHPGGDPVIEFATEPDDTVLLGAAGLVLSESPELLN
jgi:predicted NBD/HSP70 family sugar kinase